jgi:ABC-2 type transport system permease protein
MMATYAGLVVLLMLILVLNTFTERGAVEVTSILDPFGDTTVEQVTRYWTVFEKNTLLPRLEGALLMNRLLWMAIGFFSLALASPLCPFTINRRQKKLRKNRALSKSQTTQ